MFAGLRNRRDRLQLLLQSLSWIENSEQAQDSKTHLLLGCRVSRRSNSQSSAILERPSHWSPVHQSQRTQPASCTQAEPQVRGTHLMHKVCRDRHDPQTS